MRLVLVTGAGGAGRSTVAAATAVACARSGARTLLITAEPGPVPDGPEVLRVDGALAFRRRAAELRERCAAAFELLGAEPLDDEEITELPGADSLALLHALGEAPRWDTVVADLPPLPQALALLALPEQLRRYLARLLPAERQAARALRPLLAQLAGVPMPAQWLYDTAGRWADELAAVEALIRSEATTVRLVIEPGPGAGPRMAAARTGLALYGHRLEAVVANRLLPTGSSDPFLAGLSAGQQDHLKELEARHAGDGVAVLTVPHLGHAPDGPGAIERLAVPGLLPPPREDRPAADPWTVEDRLAEDGRLVWRLPLPDAGRDGLGLVRRGDELVVDVAGLRRIVPLPGALRRCTVEGAALREGALQVRFAPDPQEWPR